MRTSNRSVTRRTFFTASGAGVTAALQGTGLSAQAQRMLGISVPPQVEKANVQIVDEFCAAFASRDLVKATSLLADNCTYRVTQARPATVGRDEVAKLVKNYIDRGADFKVLKTVVLGPLVLNERDDIFPKGLGEGANAVPTTIRVTAGLFFVENGKIAEWTDYVIRS